MQQRVVLAGGCFWCLDAAFRAFRGVEGVESGYTGGHVADPTYEQVCTGHTGHAEAVRVTFDDAVLPLDVVLDAFFTMHDPTQRNRQGADVGTQYRSAMFAVDEEQRAHFVRARERAAEWWPQPIVTEIDHLGPFYLAEGYHQDFFARNPDQAYCLAVAVPKVMKVRASFREWVAESSVQ